MLTAVGGERRVAGPARAGAGPMLRAMAGSCFSTARSADTGFRMSEPFPPARWRLLAEASFHDSVSGDKLPDHRAAAAFTASTVAGRLRTGRPSSFWSDAP